MAIRIRPFATIPPTLPANAPTPARSASSNGRPVSSSAPTAPMSAPSRKPNGGNQIRPASDPSTPPQKPARRAPYTRAPTAPAAKSSACATNARTATQTSGATPTASKPRIHAAARAPTAASGTPGSMGATTPTSPSSRDAARTTSASQVTRRSSSVPGAGIAGRLARQHVQRVRQDRHQSLERLLRSGRAAGKVHDQRAASDPYDTAREHRERRRPRSLGAHPLRHAGHVAIDDVARRLGRPVARSQPGASAGQHQVGPFRVGPEAQLRADPRLLVGNQVVVDLDVRTSRENLADRLHGGIVPCAGRATVADGEDGGAVHAPTLPLPARRDTRDRPNPAPRRRRAVPCVGRRTPLEVVALKIHEYQ